MKSATTAHARPSRPAARTVRLPGTGEVSPPATLDQVCRRADEAVRRARGELALALEAEISEIERLHEGLCPGTNGADRLAVLRRRVDDVRGIGGSADYPLLADIAASLALMLDRMTGRSAPTRLTPLRLAAIAMHVRKLRQILGESRTGTGGADGARLVASLRAVAEKASA